MSASGLKLPERTEVEARAASHAPTPWKTEPLTDRFLSISDADGKRVEITCLFSWAGHETKDGWKRDVYQPHVQAPANAAFVMLAVNSYDAMRAALEAARHALVTSQGVYATDIELPRRAELIAKGAAIEWQIDDAKTLAEIDAAINLARGVKP